MAAAGGNVAGNGTASVTLVGTADQINALLQGTNYTAPSDYYGSDTLSVTTTDGGGRSSGPRSVAIVIDDIAIINEVLPLGLTVPEGGVISLAGISVSDAQNPNDTLATVLSVSHGTIQIAGSGNITGNGGGSVTIVGTANQINALLQGASYTAQADFFGDATLTVTTTDGAGALPVPDRFRSP